MYLRNVGFEILRYSIASSVVKTVSLSINDMEFPPFALIFNELNSKYRAYRDKKVLELYNNLNLNDILHNLGFLGKSCFVQFCTGIMVR
jgi:hypothetical protein